VGGAEAWEFGRVERALRDEVLDSVLILSQLRIAKRLKSELKAAGGGRR
jgi:hypothetical protein